MADPRGPILIVVDDEADIRAFVAAVANREGSWSEVIEASSASEAEQAILDRTPDAILTDIRMPGRTGLELLGALRAAGLTPRMAVMTGFQEDAALDGQIAALGVRRVLRKPFRIAELRQVLACLAG